MATITGILQSMWGVLQSFVPTGVEPVLFYTTFLLTAALTFAIMLNIKMFKENRPLAMIVALVVAYFTAGSAFVTIMISKLFPNIGLAIMAIIGVMLVLVFLAPKTFSEGLGISLPIGIIIFFVIIWLTWVFAAPALEDAGVLDTIRGTTGFGITNEDVVLVMVVIGVIAGIYFLFRGPKHESTKDPFKNFLKVFK